MAKGLEPFESTARHSENARASDVNHRPPYKMSQVRSQSTYEMTDLALITQNWLDCIDPGAPCNYVY